MLKNDVQIKIENQFKEYKDFLYKKLKKKADLLEAQLEQFEQEFVKHNEIGSLCMVTIATQDDVWICGRVYSDQNGGCGKLNEHNIYLQGSYLFSNSLSIHLDVSQCAEYSLFPGQIVLVNGRNPDGKRFLCKQIIEPQYLSKQLQKPEVVHKCDINMLVVAGPYMSNGSLDTDTVFSQIAETVRAQNVQVLVLLGPFLDANHDLLTQTNTQMTYEQHFNQIIDQIAFKLQNLNVKVIVQPSLNDLSQDVNIYPLVPFQVQPQFIKQNQSFYFVNEPCHVDINGYKLVMTTTDVIKDLTISSTSKTTQTDKISRNLSHILRQKSLYPIYPPPEHVCVDYDSWSEHCQIQTVPHLFIVTSDLIQFNKEINGTVCINPGRVLRGNCTLIRIKADQPEDQSNKENIDNQQAVISVQFQKIN